MKSSTFLGSAFSVLLAFSVISYAKTFVQDPKTVQPPQTPNQPNSEPTTGQLSTEATRQVKVSAASTGEDSKASASLPETAAEKSLASKPAVPDANPIKANESVASASQTYTATAYSLRGRTASGRPVSRGVIAADPSVLPIGTRVRVEAGSFSGEYVVADTGGGVRGRRIDIWTPSVREARQFGRRAIKLTVLSLGAKPATRRRLVH